MDKNFKRHHDITDLIAETVAKIESKNIDAKTAQQYNDLMKTLISKERLLHDEKKRIKDFTPIEFLKD